MSRRTLTALVLALLAGACGRDTTAPGAQLSAGEAQALAASLATLSGSAVGSATLGHTSVASRGGAAVASTPTPVSWTFNGNLPCPAGGTVSPNLKASGEVDTAARTASFDFSGTSSYKSCASKVQGGTIAITGTLTDSAHFSLPTATSDGSETIMEKGSIDWVKSDGTKGSCAVDLTGTGASLTQKFTLSGTVCGHSVS